MNKWMRRGAIAVLMIAGALGCAALALFAASHRDAAGHNEASISIAAPAREVWPYFADLELCKAWISGLEEYRVIPEGEPREGSQLLLSVRLDGEVFQLIEDVVAFEPASRLVLHIRAGGDAEGAFDELAEFTLVERNGRTEVLASADTDYHGLYQLFEPFMTPAAQDKIEHDLSMLHDVVEAREQAVSTR